MKLHVKPICAGMALALGALTACQGGGAEPGNHPQAEQSTPNMKDWKTKLEELLPLLGHRNWIVVTDMAYPLQAREGITTLYADGPYADVMAHLVKAVKDCPHVRPHVYQDLELQDLNDANCPGIEAYKAETAKLLKSWDVKAVRHEDLINRLDSVSRTFNVVIVKTSLQLPYTSVFLELDCKYWQ